MVISSFVVLLSSETHPIYPLLKQWVEDKSRSFEVCFVHRVSDLPPNADILFLVSCTELIHSSVRARFGHSLVLHASALPEGKGWSPHIWQILGGADKLTLSLLNAEDAVDSGDVWAVREISLDGTELYDEINEKLFLAELDLLDWACQNVNLATPAPQRAGAKSYYRRRTPEDSRVDPGATIVEQFDLLRVCDPERFPAFFEYKGQRYSVVLEKINE